MKKKIFIALAGILILCLGFVHILLSPTPNFLRNNTVDGIKCLVKISNDERSPIIRSFRKEDYVNLSEGKRRRLLDRISGKIEGDLPCIALSSDPKIYFSFKKDGKVIHPENIQLKIIAHASDYRDPIKTQTLEKKPVLFNDQVYFYESRRYRTQFEKYFIEYLRLELSYQVDGVNYLSTFACNQSNAPDGTDFFKNEDLTPPLDPPQDKI